jgi:Na+/melibiose symporter-like transporter
MMYLQLQSNELKTTLRVIFAVVPIILVSIALYFAFRYPLIHDIHNRLNQLLANRRAGESETEEMREEAKKLERLLIGG